MATETLGITWKENTGPFSFRDDCMDAGGRAMHGAIAEKDRMRGFNNKDFFFILIPLPNPLPEGEGV